MSGFVTSWLDGERIFTLIGASVGGWTSAADERFAVLEAALRFTAPIETALTDAAAKLTADCSVFTSTSVRTIALRISPDSTTEAYFKSLPRCRRLTERRSGPTRHGCGPAGRRPRARMGLR